MVLEFFLCYSKFYLLALNNQTGNHRAVIEIQLRQLKFLKMFIKAVSDIVLDMVNAIYHDKPIDLYKTAFYLLQR